MQFKEKINGKTEVTDFNTTPIFNSMVVWLSDIMEKVQSQDAMDYILSYYSFIKGEGERSHDWYTMIDQDSIMKISALENSPSDVEEFEKYFGKGWLNKYIHFSQ